MAFVALGHCLPAADNRHCEGTTTAKEEHVAHPPPENRDMLA